MRKIMASLDIGSSSLKLIVGEVVKKKLNILAVAEVESKGVKKGKIVSEENFLISLEEVFKKGEEIIGLKIAQVIVNVPQADAEFLVSEGSINVATENNVITGREIIDVLQDAVNNQIGSNMELVNIMPVSFKVDKDKITNNPKGMIGNKLMVKVVLAIAPKRSIYPILDCLEKLNIEVLDISFGAMGDYYALKKEKMANEIGVIVNLGEDTTSLAVINRGSLTNVKVLELGSANIDNDISFIYKVTTKEAKHLKENLALAHKRLAVAADCEIVTNKLGEEIKINQYELSEIVMSRIEEILNVAKKQINLLTKKEISYIIFTGGLTEIVDFSLVLEEIFGKNVILGRMNEIGARNNKYSTAVGMIKYYAERMKLKGKDFSIFDIEDQKEFSGMHKKINVNDSSVLGKLFGYFFDN